MGEPEEDDEEYGEIDGVFCDGYEGEDIPWDAEDKGPREDDGGDIE